MELTIEQAMQQAVAAQREGRLQEVELLYRSILQSQPTHADANHNLGVLAVSVNNADAALPLFKTALKANPKVEQFWLSYIDALIQVKQFENAKQVLEQARENGVDENILNSLEGQLSPKTQESNTAGVSPPQELLDTLLEHYQKRRLDDAEKLAISITQEFSEHAFGWKVLGAILKRLGRINESFSATQKSVQLEPKDAKAHYNFGNTLTVLDRLDEAVASFHKAIELKPSFAEAHSNLGNALKRLGRLDEAKASYNQAIALKPDLAEAHSNLGLTLQELGRLDEAEASYNHAIVLKPDLAEAYYNLGNTLQELGRLDEAEASYKQAIALRHDYAEAHNNLGLTLQELGRLDEAEANCNRAIVLKPDLAEAHSNLGIVLFEKGDDVGALNCFQQSCDLKRRGKALNGHYQGKPAVISKSKLNHDIDQFEYLASRSIQKNHFSNLAAEYRRIRDETFWPSETGLTKIDPAFRSILGNSSKLLHLGQADRVYQALDSSLDTSTICNTYFSHEFGLTYIDNFLSSDALESLRKFLLESTIWFEQKQGGYLGAYLKDGLASPLILQIASELKSKFPLIIKNHALNQVWAYKYDNRSLDSDSGITGIKIHADFAAVNVNFWITQSEANLESDSGGMVVYNTEAPREWSFNMYNNNLSRIQGELSKSSSGREVIPHRENRMVIFNSNLFHETDNYHFKEGYENRRINVTMLFGRREDNW